MWTTLRGNDEFIPMVEARHAYLTNLKLVGGTAALGVLLSCGIAYGYGRWIATQTPTTAPASSRVVTESVYVTPEPVRTTVWSSPAATAVTQ